MWYLYHRQLSPKSHSKPLFRMWGARGPKLKLTHSKRGRALIKFLFTFGVLLLHPKTHSLHWTVSEEAPWAGAENEHKVTSKCHPLAALQPAGDRQHFQIKSLVQHRTIRQANTSLFSVNSKLLICQNTRCLPKTPLILYAGLKYLCCPAWCCQCWEILETRVLWFTLRTAERNVSSFYF